jgi:hypothetical protein
MRDERPVHGQDVTPPAMLPMPSFRFPSANVRMFVDVNTLELGFLDDIPDETQPLRRAPMSYAAPRLLPVPPVVIDGATLDRPTTPAGADAGRATDRFEPGVCHARGWFTARLRLPRKPCGPARRAIRDSPASLLATWAMCSLA